jgi:hypothetical protein
MIDGKIAMALPKPASMTLTVAPAVCIYDVDFHSHMFVREAALTYPHIDARRGKSSSLFRAMETEADRKVGDETATARQLMATCLIRRCQRHITRMRAPSRPFDKPEQTIGNEPGSGRIYVAVALRMLAMCKEPLGHD